jgi:nitrogenase molybdenum-iron protein beta chain
MTTTIAEKPRYTCTLGGAIPSVASIYRVIPILHAGPGCGMQLYNGLNYVAGFQAPGYVGSSAVPGTNTTEREVVFGGEPRLREIVQSSLEVMDGDYYVILTGCTPDIIGDDVGSVANDFRKEGHPIAYTLTPGFKGSTYQGYELVWKAFLDQVVEKPTERNDRSVNLFGIVPAQDVFWQGSLEEIARLLNGLGLTVNTFYTDRQGIEAVRHSSEAALNIVLSPWVGSEIVETYENLFEIPWLRFDGVPIGPTATESFLRSVAGTLELDPTRVDEFIEKENRWAFDQLSKSLLALTGFDFHQRIAVLGDANSVVSIVRFLVNDFGQIPIVAVITDNAPEDAHKHIVRVLNDLEYGEKLKVVFTTDHWEAWNAVRESGTTYILGSSLDKELAQELGVLHLSVSFPITDRVILSHSYAGNRGAISLVEDFFAPAVSCL